MSERTTTGAPPALHWDSLHRLQRVQVFGAGSALGREVAVEFLRAGHPPGLLALFGRRPASFSWRGEVLEVRPIDGTEPRAEVAVLCTELEAAREILPRLQGRGTKVVDLSGAAAEDPATELVDEPVNGDTISAFSEVVALVRRDVLALGRTLGPLHRAATLVGVDAFCVRSAASGGARSILALRQERAGGAGDGRVGNLQPTAVEVQEAMRAQLRRFLGNPELPVDVQALDGDVERCDVLAVKARFSSHLTPEDVQRLLAQTPGVALALEGPDPRTSAGSDLVHVGRIRAGTSGVGSLCFLAVADQLRAGAAAAALRAACRLPATG